LLLGSVMSLLGRHAPPVAAVKPRPEAPRLLVPDIALPDDDDPDWPSARISVAEALWGEGFLLPGGEEEALRLAKPLGLSAASSLMLVGAGIGGAMRCIATEFGVWVTGYEANLHLVAMGNERSLRAGLGRRAQIEIWKPASPQFPLHYYHHGIAIEPLCGTKPDAMLGALSLALKPGGQLVLLELVADRELDAADPTVIAWARLDHRSAIVPSELMITKLLGHLGFDVRIVEDVSRRQLQHATGGWREAVHAMAGSRPTLRQLALVVREAELWLARSRLMRTGKLRLVRWNAIGRGGPPG
jgi:hypothetical protein